MISIHVLREEDDADLRPCRQLHRAISIHVLREEDDMAICGILGILPIFQSTSSARRTTREGRIYGTSYDDISIHVLREEDDVRYEGRR